MRFESFYNPLRAIYAEDHSLDLERALSHALHFMIQTVKRMLSRSTQEPVVECRNCGANVEPEAESCPLCASTEIAHYEIDS